MDRFAVSSQKGGVGKTTTAANLAAVWGSLGRSVLAVDLDPQFGLTRAFGLAPSQAPATVVEVLSGRAELGAAVIEKALPGVALLSGHRDLAGLELALAAEYKREEFLAGALAEADHYDVVLIDCPPNLGLLTVNALFAAPAVLAPVSMLDTGALQGVGELRATVARLAERGVDVAIAAAVRTLADRRRVSYQAIAPALERLGVPLAAAEIPLRAEFNTSLVAGVPLALRRPDSAGALAYRRLGEELVAGVGAEMAA